MLAPRQRQACFLLPRTHPPPERVVLNICRGVDQKPHERPVVPRFRTLVSQKGYQRYFLGSFHHVTPDTPKTEMAAARFFFFYLVSPSVSPSHPNAFALASRHEPHREPSRRPLLPPHHRGHAAGHFEEPLREPRLDPRPSVHVPRVGHGRAPARTCLGRRSAHLRGTAVRGKDNTKEKQEQVSAKGRAGQGRAVSCTCGACARA